MSIGIFDLNLSNARRAGIALVCCALVSACSSGDGAGFSFAPRGDAGTGVTGAQESPAIPKSTKATLARGAITLKAPKGYCIDETSISNGLQGSSAMLAKCSSLDGKGAGANASVLSVSVSARRGDSALAPSANDLAESLAPRKILSRSQRGTLALVQVGSDGDKVFLPADPAHWRAATLLDTRLVLLGLFAPAGSDLAGDKGADVLVSLAKGISATRGSVFSRRSATPSVSEEAVKQKQPIDAVEKTVPDTVEPKKKGVSGLIGRLLNRS